MKLTRLVHHIVCAFFLICLLSDLLIKCYIEVVRAILLYALWFSFGLLAGSFLLYYVMRKDIDNAQKQFEKEREKRSGFSVN